MKIAGNVLSIVSLILLVSTLICGFWIRSQTPAGSAPDASSITFHMQIAVASLVFVAITLGVLIFSK